MFVDALKQQLTEEQKKKWLPLAQNFTAIGTYAQTELGHGSFIRGLETTATFDEKTDQFVIHSPTLTSTKWWPGNLGKSSNHCIVMAQLIIKGKNYGLQGFIVPIRDLKTHKPLPGVTVGDIGPKFGYEMIDNGFLRFNQVRIPRDNMLMRYNAVDRNGKFTASKHSKILYATMVYTRVAIVGAMGWSLGRAATVAARYSAVRKQFPPSEGGKDEVAVIDYQTQQQKIIPNFASAYTIYFSYLWLKDLYDKNGDAVAKGDFSLMPELHAVAACLKSLSSEICVEGMEICRKSCGGHGYMKLTGSKWLMISSRFSCYVSH
jgi:acyl-CoA oxidase